MEIRKTLIAVVAVIAVIAGACTSNSDSTAPETTTTTFDFPELEFGRGVLPASVPALWPTPDESVIGATMMDGTRRLTEIVVTYPATVSDVASYYTTNLPVLGFEVTDASGTDGKFTIEFSGNGVTGTIVLTTGGTGLTAGTIQMVHQ
ncbi:MAG: hypothetical protein M3092_02635 [Actinomycetia bacterium]|nr:hypothetical protein [Actinomycetes bacterium]